MAEHLIVKNDRGENEAVDLGVDTYRAASDAGLSLPQYLARQHSVNAERDGSVMAQLMEQCGIVVGRDKEFGLVPSKLGDLTSPEKSAAGNVITRDGVPASRLLFPAVMLGIIEDKLTRDLSTSANALNSMVALEDSIVGEKWERPVLNMSRPEGARAKPVAQLALPDVMLSVTVSDTSARVPTYGIGLEISEQAMKATSLDYVGLAVARQAAVEANERAEQSLLSLLTGDADFKMVALSALSGKVQAASSLDAAASSGLTQKAWITWLSQRANYRTITHVITDLAGAMAIENRAGKPVVTGDNPTSVRIDTLMQVINPQWTSNVKLFITTDPNWPAKTIMGIDARYAIHRVRSVTAQYKAIEEFVLQRKTSMRFDSGEMLTRFFDEAFEVLTYA